MGVPAKRNGFLEVKQETWRPGSKLRTILNETLIPAANVMPVNVAGHKCLDRIGGYKLIRLSEAWQKADGASAPGATKTANGNSWSPIVLPGDVAVVISQCLEALIGSAVGTRRWRGNGGLAPPFFILLNRLRCQEDDLHPRDKIRGAF